MRYLGRRQVLEMLRAQIASSHVTSSEPTIFERSRTLAWILADYPSTELAAWLLLNRCRLGNKFLTKYKKRAKKDPNCKEVYRLIQYWTAHLRWSGPTLHQ